MDISLCQKRGVWSCRTFVTLLTASLVKYCNMFQPVGYHCNQPLNDCWKFIQRSYPTSDLYEIVHVQYEILRLAPSDAVIDEDEVDDVELYLFFAHNVLATVEKSLLLLEKDSTCIIDVPNILNQLYQNLNSRIQQKFLVLKRHRKWSR